MLTMNGFGQELKIDLDKKVIYTDSLNLPSNTSALTLMSLLPELIQRPGDFLVSNYDIQIEDMSVGSAIDVTLSQMQIADIEKVEVNESPVTSYQKNGQGGTINFVLRSSGANNSNQWGSAGLIVTSPLDAGPQFSYGYRNDKFMIRAIVLGELNNYSTDTQTLTFASDPLNSPAMTFTGLSNTSSDNRFRNELALAYLQYDLTAKDRLTLNLSESYTYKRNNSITDFSDANSVRQKQKTTDLHAFLKYKHSTSRSSLTAQLEYMYTPATNLNDVTGQYKNESELKSNNLSGKLEYKTFIFKNAAADGMLKQGELTIGTNFNCVFSEQTYTIDDAIIASPITKLMPQNNTYYLMPYITFSCTLGKLRFKATGEYQHFKYDVKHLDEPFSAISNDVTAQVVTEYHFTPDNTLRLMLDRKLQRPTSNQMFPYSFYDAGRREYVQGNPNLTPTMMHQITLDYVGLHRWNRYQRLTYNAGISCNSIIDILSDVQMGQGNHKPGTIGLQKKYLTFENRGANKIVSANLMALYTYKTFSLSVAGNLYYKKEDALLGGNHYKYYNLSVHPHFKLKEGWHGGACLMYYSRIEQQNGHIGDCAIMDMSVGKAWGNFYIFLEETVSLAKHCTDVSFSSSSREEKNYMLSPNTVSAGFRYTF